MAATPSKASVQGGNGKAAASLAATSQLAADEVPAAVEKAVFGRLHAWAANWSRQDVPGYLSFYGKAFRPADGLGRGRWEKMRRLLLSRPARIEVSLSELHATEMGEDFVRVIAVQRYRSNLYHDRTLKAFTFGKQDGQWVILAEESMGTFKR